MLVASVSFTQAFHQTGCLQLLFFDDGFHVYGDLGNGLGFVGGDGGEPRSRRKAPATINSRRGLDTTSPEAHFAIAATCPIAPLIFVNGCSLSSVAGGGHRSVAEALIPLDAARSSETSQIHGWKVNGGAPLYSTNES
ncbi:hypothetical protein TIFTF001_020022 [Ficus carica]|uniref:Uncharacterized protein n=1 Tax=Ficus carica TaxID=3494 RepID=A0AA88AEM1_FICCA|nr:hypothetical protein TIFTF001_020022 [Ficus carica]